MRVAIIAGIVLLAGCTANSGPAVIHGPVSIGPENADRIRKAGSEILFWSQEERDANFQKMDQLFPGTIAKAATRPRALPAGVPIGLDGEAEAFMAKYNIAGVIVVQDGKVRLERYARGHSRDGRYTSFSVAKSLTSTLVGAAIQDGYIRSLDDPVTTYIPELKGSNYEGVTVRQVLTMTSGIKWNEDYTDPNSDVVRTYAEPSPAGRDPTAHYLSGLPREAEPGAKWVYKTGETNLIGVLVAKATGRTLTQYLQEKIWQPFGMERDLFWMVDSSGQNIGGCCLSASLRDYARIGEFVLEGGKAGGTQVVPAGWFGEAAKNHIGDVIAPRGYGYQWWINGDATFQAQGIFGQLIYINPGKKLVIAMSAAWPNATGRELSAARQKFVSEVVAATR